MNKHNPRYPAARCPSCGHHLWPNRFGQPVSPLKARIIDMVGAAGPDGINSDVLVERLGGKMTKLVLKVHVSQINDRLELAGYRIETVHGDRHSRRLVQL